MQLPLAMGLAAACTAGFIDLSVPVPCGRFEVDTRQIGPGHPVGFMNSKRLVCVFAPTAADGKVFASTLEHQQDAHP